MRNELALSERQLEHANTKAQDLTIRKLTWGNPTMRAKFAAARKKAADEAAAHEESMNGAMQIEAHVLDVEDADDE